jgi:threonine dehydrogenase-like Zn-dependent dehydrogenase
MPVSRFAFTDNLCHAKPSKEDHELGSELFEKLPSLLREGKIKPNPVKVFNTGLDGVTDGFQEFRDGKVSGYKIVYKI